MENEATAFPSVQTLNRSRIPLAVKLVYTAFVATLVPYYWHAYGVQNFLFFCDVALLMTAVGLWVESRLLLSAATVGILLPQTLWLVDFVVGLTGHTLTGMTDYMHDRSIPLFVRGLSTFHGWLPILLVWVLSQIGYDRRAFTVQTVLGVSLLLVCYFGFPPPSHAGGFNIDYVYGMDEHKPQTFMQPRLWFAMIVVAIPTLMYLPAHMLLRWWFGSKIPSPTSA